MSYVHWKLSFRFTCKVKILHLEVTCNGPLAGWADYWNVNIRLIMIIMRKGLEGGRRLKETVMLNFWLWGFVSALQTWIIGCLELKQQTWHVEKRMGHMFTGPFWKNWVIVFVDKWLVYSLTKSPGLVFVNFYQCRLAVRVLFLSGVEAETEKKKSETCFV